MKKFGCLILALILAFSVFALPASAAYKPTFELHSGAAILYNTDTDTVLFSDNADKRIYPASLTKIMVAVLLVENVPDLENLTVEISEDIYLEYRYSEAVIAGFNAGDKVNGNDLLAYTMVKSCADAAAAIAVEVAGSESAFVEMMNKKAIEIGMTGTHFTNCHGLHSPDHYSTARDLCILTKYAMQYSAITDIVKVARYVTKDEVTLAATNLMIDPTSDYYYRYATGFKTGYTDEAGRCLASTASFEGMTYICILVGCPAVENSIENRYEFLDSAELYRWAFLNFSYRSVLGKSETVDSIPIKYSWDYDTLNIRPESRVFAIMPNEADDSTIDIKVDYISDTVEAPVKKGTVLGTINIYYANELIGSVNAVAASSVEGSQLLKLFSGVGEFLSEHKKLIAAIVLALLLVIIGFIFAVIRLNSKRKKYGKVRNYKRF